MSRLFLYGRVSTTEQDPQNQSLEIQQAGYTIDRKRIVLEQISGSTPADARNRLRKLKDKLEASDTLIVTKLDRLGSDSIDVQQQVEWFKANEIRLDSITTWQLGPHVRSGLIYSQNTSRCSRF